MTPITATGLQVLLVLAALAAMLIASITLLAGVGATIPDELRTGLTILIAAVAGGSAVKGADVLAERRREQVRKAWSGESVNT